MRRESSDAHEAFWTFVLIAWVIASDAWDAFTNLFRRPQREPLRVPCPRCQELERENRALRDKIR